MKKLLLIFIFFSLTFCDLNNVCLNRENLAVDWYVIFLLPSSISNDNELIYGYFDETIKNTKYFKYEEKNFPPNLITKNVKNNWKNLNYFFWNDDKTIKDSSSESSSNSKAHAKGSLIYDKENGNFLLHSLPRFPTRNEKNEILTELPSNGGAYGQNFLCISITKNSAEKIAELLNYINVSINKSVEKDQINKIPNKWINALIQNKMQNNYPKSHNIIIKSKNGIEFEFIGKSGSNKIIPYETTLRNLYKDDFYIRTWTRPSLAPSLYDDKYKLINVLDVNYGGYKYGKTKEHSKWAVAKRQNIVCFGDLNHTESQKDRGGHIVCFKNKQLNYFMKSVIAKLESKEEVLLEKVRNISKNGDIN